MIVAVAHPPEFRRRAVELVRRGDRPIAQLAARLQISESCLRRWVDQAAIDENGSDTRLTSVEKRELMRLRWEKRRLQRENELLKRAVAYLARQSMAGDSASAACATAKPEDLAGLQVDTVSCC